MPARVLPMLPMTCRRFYAKLGSAAACENYAALLFACAQAGGDTLCVEGRCRPSVACRQCAPLPAAVWPRPSSGSPAALAWLPPPADADVVYGREIDTDLLISHFRWASHNSLWEGG